MQNDYNWIDKNVAIGNCESDYGPFDVIVNLNYPFNKVEHNNIKREINIIKYKEKIIFNIGINDNENERMLDILKSVIPKLLRLYEQDKNIKILFHCYAGISRSTTLAVAFLCKAKGISLEDALMMCKNQRSIIKPNPGFLKALNEYITYT
jgi:protein-tyrosine phosphatase